MADFKSSAIKALKDQNPLWFACDVSAASFRTEGILSTEVCNVEELFGIDLKYDKYESVRFRSTSCNHAMTLTGVNLVDSFPNRWKVQNSWGKDFGKDGFFVMSDAWFDRFVYQVVVNKKYLSENVLKALDTDSIELKPWEQVA
jgi:bleomycin hydrolase